MLSSVKPHKMKSSPTKPAARTETRAVNSSRPQTLFGRQSCRRELRAFASKPSDVDKALPTLPLASHVAEAVELEAPVHARSVAARDGQESIVEVGGLLLCGSTSNLVGGSARLANFWSLLQEYDVLGLGQLMVDYAAAVDDSMLATLDVPKGGRR